MSMVKERFSSMEKRNKLITLSIIVLLCGSVLYLGRGSLATFLSGELSMQSGLSSSDTSVSATLSATLGGEDVSITYAQSMFGGMSIFKQASYDLGGVSLSGPDDIEYEEFTTGNQLSVHAEGYTLTGVAIKDITTGHIETKPIWEDEDPETGYPNGWFIGSVQYNIDGLTIGTYEYEIYATSSSGDGPRYTITVTVVASTDPDYVGQAIDSLNITMNWDTTMYRVQEDTFSLTYSIYVEASPTGEDNLNDYVVEKLIQDTTVNADGSISFVLQCGTDICLVENLYNSIWNIRIRIVLEASILDDLGQPMDSTLELEPAKLIVVWDAEFSVTGSWE